MQRKIWKRLVRDSYRLYEACKSCPPVEEFSDRAAFRPISTVLTTVEHKQSQNGDVNSHLDNLIHSVQHMSLLETQPRRTATSQGTTLTIAEPDVLTTACPICLESKSDAPCLQWTKTPCCHQFLHFTCMKTALQHDARCVLCRHNVS